MKVGLDHATLITELENQRKASNDYVVDTRELTLFTPAKDTEGVQELHLPGGLGEHALATTAQRQMASRLQLGWKLWQRFQQDHPDLLDHNVNTLLRREPDMRMVRTFDWSAVPGMESRGKIARCFVSDRYRRLDNYDLMGNVLIPAIQELGENHGAQVASMDLTDRHLYLKVVLPRVQGEVNVGDVVQSGFIVKNSEIGAGALSVQPLIFRLVCKNGMITGKATRHFHLGRALETDETMRVLSDEARQADDTALWLKLRDVIRATADETIFNQVLTQMRDAAAAEPMEKPIQAMEKLSKTFGLSDGEHEGALQHLLSDGDLSLWGAVNAVTRLSQDVESYERATELEEMGGEILAMSNSAWRSIATTGA
jgi:hypothetical protein